MRPWRWKGTAKRTAVRCGDIRVPKGRQKKLGWDAEAEIRGMGYQKKLATSPEDWI